MANHSYKKLLDDAIVRRSASHAMFCWSIAGWRKWRASAGGVDFASLRHQHIGARVPVAWLNPTKPPAFSTPPARPANLKACSVTLADMRWRWQPRWTPFLAAKRAVCSLCFGYRLGGGAFVLWSTRRCWRGWRLSFTKDTDLAGLRRVVENRRNIRLAGCSQRRPPFAC